MELFLLFEDQGVSAPLCRHSASWESSSTHWKHSCMLLVPFLPELCVAGLVHLSLVPQGAMAHPPSVRTADKQGMRSLVAMEPPFLAACASRCEGDGGRRATRHDGEIRTENRMKTNSFPLFFSYFSCEGPPLGSGVNSWVNFRGDEGRPHHGKQGLCFAGEGATGGGREADVET